MHELPAEALRQLATPIHRPQERRVSITSETHQELLAFLHPFQAWHGVVSTGDGVKDVVNQGPSQFFVGQVFFEGLVVPV